MSKSFLIIFIAIFCLASCKSKKSVSQNQVPGTDIEFVEISKSSFSDLQKPENTFISSEGEWKEFWAKAQANVQPTPELPAIDFSTQTLLVSCMGMRNSGGYATEITDVKIKDDMAYAQVVQSSPGKNCMATMAITYPFHIVSINKTGIKDVVFRIDERVDDCK